MRFVKLLGGSLLGFLVVLTSLATAYDLALATEIRIVPVTSDPTGTCAGIPGNTACDLVRAAAGLPPVTGPDQGVTPNGGDVLVLESGTYTLIPATGAAPNDGSGSVEVLLDNLTIRCNSAQGGSVANTIVSGDGLLRVFNILSQKTVTIECLTIKDGRAANGGGIFNDGNLTVTNSILEDHHAENTGGAIRNRNRLTIESSVIRNNEAELFAGAIRNNDGSNGGTSWLKINQSSILDNISHECCGAIRSVGRVTIKKSTIGGNEATGTDGGGIVSFGILELENSTISGNVAKNGVGGGIYNVFGYGQALVRIEYSTIAKNHAGTSGGGIQNEGTLNLYNTIAAGNSKASGDSDIEGTNAGGTYNCIGDGATAGGLLTPDHNILDCDPDLGALSDNGGPTLTHALQANSEAIDAANPNNCIVDDQRGVSRPQPTGGICDIGAYEAEAAAPGLDVSMEKLAVDHPWEVGEEGTFEFTIQNTGDEITSGVTVVVEDTLPNGLSVVPGSLAPPPSAWSCIVIGQTITCNYVGSYPIDAGDFFPPFSFNVIADPIPVAVISYENCATVMVTGAGAPVTEEACVDVTVEAGLGSPDLVVDNVAFDEQCNATFNICNIGNADATDNFPFIASPIEHPSGQTTGWSASIPELAAGDCITQEWPDVGVFGSTIYVTVDPQNSVDESDETNNESSFQVPVDCCEDLVIDVSTGTTDGAPDSFGTPDADWVVTSSPDGTTGPAFSIEPDSHWITNPSANWVDYDGSGGDFNGANDPIGDYTYEFEFSIPSGWSAGACELSFTYAGDNQVEFLLNGNPLQTSPNEEPFDILYGPVTTAVAPGTSNVLEAQVNNNELVSGLLVVGEVRCECPSGGPDLIESDCAAVAIALDENNNDHIDDAEILTAMEYWITGETVPGTDLVIDDSIILCLVEGWISGESVSGLGLHVAFLPRDYLKRSRTLSLEQTSIARQGSQFTLNVRGQGIEQVNLQVFDLAGRRVLDQTSPGTQLHFAAADTAGRRWANGVYLYVVTVHGYNGQIVRSEVKKLALLN